MNEAEFGPGGEGEPPAYVGVAGEESEDERARRPRELEARGDSRGGAGEEEGAAGSALSELRGADCTGLKRGGVFSREGKTERSEDLWGQS